MDFINKNGLAIVYITSIEIYEHCGSKFCMGKKNVEHDMSLF